MKIHSNFLRLGLLLAATALPAGHARAATLSFHLDLSTASLIGNAAGPFSLDLSLYQGNGLSNTITVSNFVFTLGAPVGGTVVTTGGASGSLGASGVTLTDSSPFNDLYQVFSGTTTGISFDVTTTLNASAGTPNEFTVSILDSAKLPILTTSPGAGTAAETDYLVGMPVDDATNFNSVRTYSSTLVGSTTPGVSVTASPVPEPSTVALGAVLSLGVLGGMARRRSPRGA